MEWKEIPYEIDPETMTGGVGDEFKSPAPRSEGPHLGSIIRDIENRVIKPGERRPYDELTPQEKARMGRYVEMGFIWEVVVETVWKRRMLGRREAAGVIRQTELTVDGIHMTPDGIHIPAYSVDEYKATWLSSNHPIDGPKFWAWHHQMMGYLTGTERTFGSCSGTADLYVFYVNGDYRESGPQAKHFVFKFSTRERRESWEMVKRHRDSLMKEGKWHSKEQKRKRR